MEILMVRPIGKRVLVKANEFKEESTTSTGIVYETESTNTTETSKGVIIAVGDEVNILKKGEEIYYETFGGHKVTVDGEQLVILQEINVIGVIENV